jgi:hypothetical protein
MRKENIVPKKMRMGERKEKNVGKILRMGKRKEKKERER